jgi:hypothetical protein
LETNISYAVPATALRVFHGFRNPSLNQDQYLHSLGQTFMPGTPYMLAPLGLAAYLPGIVVGEQDPRVPNEFAIIAYPSPEIWDHIMHQTLRGRVYDQTHGGVYDPRRSGASFPVFVKHLPPIATDPYYLFDCLTDWQVGVTQVLIGAPIDNSVAPSEFRNAVRSAVETSIPQLERLGFDQCVVMPGDGYVVIWSHANASDKAGIPDWKVLGAKVRVIANLTARRIVCRDEPSPITLTQTAALNFVFLRAPGMFLS